MFHLLSPLQDDKHLNLMWYTGTANARLEGGWDLIPWDVKPCTNTESYNSNLFYSAYAVYEPEPVIGHLKSECQVSPSEEEDPEIPMTFNDPSVSPLSVQIFGMMLGCQTFLGGQNQPVSSMQQRDAIRKLLCPPWESTPKPGNIRAVRWEKPPYWNR